MYHVGQVVEGQITGIKPYGAFVSIDATTLGLVHISELSDGFVKEVEAFVKIGEKIKLKILEIDPTNHQLRLSLKALQTNLRKSRPRLKPMIMSRERIGFASLRAHLNDWIMDAKKEKNHD